MTGPTSVAVSRLPVMVRWSARGLSLLVLLFWGFFIVAHLVGEEGRPSRPLITQDYIILSMLTGSLTGLALAWKWEFTGAALTLLTVTICALVNWRVLVFPGTLFLVVPGLFLTSWWLNRTPRRDRG